MQLIYNRQFIPEGMVRLVGQAFLKKLQCGARRANDIDAHVGHVIEFEDGTLELCINAYPYPGRPMEVVLNNAVPVQTTSIVAILEFDEGYTRFDIGEAIFAGKKATLFFYGTPANEARLIILPGPQETEISSDAKK